MCVHVDIYVYFLSIFLSLLRNIACYHISQSFLRLRTEGAPGRVPVGGRTKGEGEEEHEEEEEEQEQEQEQEEQEEAGHVLVFSLSLSLSFWCFHIIFLFVARCLWGFPSRASCLLSLILLERSGHHPPIFSFFLHLVFFSSFFCCVCVCVCVCSSCGVWRHRSPKDTLKINWPRYCLVWEIPLRYSLPFHQWDGRRDALPSFFFFTGFIKSRTASSTVSSDFNVGSSLYQISLDLLRFAGCYNMTNRRSPRDLVVKCPIAFT